MTLTGGFDPDPTAICLVWVGINKPLMTRYDRPLRHIDATGGSMRLFTIALVSAINIITPASATTYVLEGKGTVSSASVTLDEGKSFQPVSSGKIMVGDAFTFSATFDIDKAKLTSLYDADPAVNIYYLAGSSVSVAAGSYSSSFVTEGSIQLWNDRIVTHDPTDLQSWEFFNYDFKGNVPYDLGGGLNSQMVILQSFDWSGLSRSSDLISELVADQSEFGSNSLIYTYSTGPNPSVGTPRPIVVTQTSNIQWSLNILPSAVPEPATWALMILGFGAVGYSMRRKKAVVRFA